MRQIGAQPPRPASLPAACPPLPPLQRCRSAGATLCAAARGGRLPPAAPGRRCCCLALADPSRPPYPQARRAAQLTKPPGALSAWLQPGAGSQKIQAWQLLHRAALCRPAARRQQEVERLCHGPRHRPRAPLPPAAGLGHHGPPKAPPQNHRWARRGLPSGMERLAAALQIKKYSLKQPLRSPSQVGAARLPCMRACRPAGLPACLPASAWQPAVLEAGVASRRRHPPHRFNHGARPM